MSSQIQIAQSKKDEIEMVALTHGDHEFLYHSRIFKSGTFHPWAFNSNLALKLQCFLRRDEKIVCDRISPVQPSWWNPDAKQKEPDSCGEQQINPSLGLSIEWIRTHWSTSATCVGGRLYLDGKNLVSERILKDLAKIFKRVAAMIRRDYPKRNTGRFPCYVGPDLSRKIESGEVRLLYAGGKEMPLVDNG